LTRLEKLTRMLTTNLGTSADFGDAMIAEALRVATQSDIDENLRSAFMKSLAAAFDDTPGPAATIRAGRRGRQALKNGPLGVSARAMDVYDYLTEAKNRRHKQEAAIVTLQVRHAVTRSVILQDYADVRAAIDRVRSGFRRPRGRAQSDE